ncbi:hypothetical protein ACIGXM_32010 [Kitasatospora sp. NPDC052896]|uniref:hypothetical protein n=1 Tax=Kitasatospora sp. NPDC052896 TaxID=3364061 RepID=UPI0037CC7C0D
MRGSIRTALAGAVGSCLLAVLAPTAASAATTSTTTPAPVDCATPPGGRTDAVRLAPGQTLYPGKSLTNGTENLTMQDDGNLVMYLRDADGHNGPAIWNSGTWGHINAEAQMQQDGNLVIYTSPDMDYRPIWNTGTWGHPGSCAVLGANGDFQVMSHQKSGTALVIWHTATGQPNPGDTDPTRLQAGAAMGPGDWRASRTTWLVLQGDGNLVLYRKSDNAPLWNTGTSGHKNPVATMNADGNLRLVWADNGPDWGITGSTSSNTSGNPGATAVVQDDGNFVIYRTDGKPVWQSGTWGKA